MYHVGRVIALGIKGGGQRQDLSWTKLDAEAAGLTTLHHDGYSAFRHKPSSGVIGHPENDYAVAEFQPGVTLITGVGEVRHRAVGIIRAGLGSMKFVRWLQYST
jgi:hypothetical protein